MDQSEDFRRRSKEEIYAYDLQTRGRSKARSLTSGPYPGRLPPTGSIGETLARRRSDGFAGNVLPVDFTPRQARFPSVIRHTRLPPKREVSVEIPTEGSSKEVELIDKERLEVVSPISGFQNSAEEKLQIDTVLSPNSWEYQEASATIKVLGKVNNSLTSSTNSQPSIHRSKQGTLIAVPLTRQSLRRATNSQPLSGSSSELFKSLNSKENSRTNSLDQFKTKAFHNGTAFLLDEQETTPFGEGIGKKTLFTIISLFIVIVLLLGGFIPAVVLLSQGTKDSVSNFFRSEANRNVVLPGLIQKYGLSKKSPNIPSHLLSDIEIMDLLKDTGEPIFRGVAYSPLDAMEPKCGISKRSTMLDLAKISTVTNVIRNYGMQCNQLELILDSIQTLDIKMKLTMGVWIGHNDTINQQQLQLMKDILAKYPATLIESIFVGNEVLFRKDKPVKDLIKYIRETKDYIKSIGLYIPVGTSEIGLLITSELLAACEIVGANIHPFFSGDTVENAAEWTLNFLRFQIEPKNTKNVKIVISEIGWPTAGGSFQRSVATLPNLKFFIQDFICKIGKHNYDYYMFEAFDEPWKRIFYKGKNRWETEWGIFTKDRKSKLDWRDMRGCEASL